LLTQEAKDALIAESAMVIHWLNCINISASKSSQTKSSNLQKS
jgi:hypothetical protein